MACQLARVGQDFNLVHMDGKDGPTRDKDGSTDSAHFFAACASSVFLLALAADARKWEQVC